MASGKTGNFELNLWDQSDQILMEDFNSDNAKTDAALKAAADGNTCVFLRKIVAGADANQVDLDVSDVNWSTYHQLLIHVDAECDSGAVIIRLNGLAGSEDYRYLNSSQTAQVSSNCGFFFPNTSTVTYYTTLTLTGGITYPECKTTTAGTAITRIYYCVNALVNPVVTVNLFNSTAPIKAGAAITIYGVKI